MEDFEKFYNSALKFLSYRPRSEKEIRDKLKTKNVEPGAIERIIIKLKEKKFINDEEFARMFLENRLRFKPRSARLIKLELKQKGIDQEVIDKILGYEDIKILSDEELAIKLIEKKIKRLKGLEKQEIYQKLGRFLAAKGFGWDTIKKAVDEILDKGV